MGFSRDDELLHVFLHLIQCIGHFRKIDNYDFAAGHLILFALPLSRFLTNNVMITVKS